MERYLSWQAGTVNRTLTILELGEGFASPTVMRWPFEKIIFFNRKALLYRVNEGILSDTQGGTGTQHSGAWKFSGMDF